MQISLNTFGSRTALKMTSPPSRALPEGRTDRFVLSELNDADTYTASNWAGHRSPQTRGKMTGKQVAALAIGTTAALAGLVGVMASGAMSPPSSAAPKTEIVQEAPQELQENPLVETTVQVEATQQQTSFQEGRDLLVDRSHRVKADQFQPDPSQAIGQRGDFITYSESYIDSLLNRNLTEVPQGQPSFTAHQVDPGQSTKLYFDADLNEADWGYGAVRSGDFYTRPDRMKQGMGLRDEITQHQLSAIYRLEETATVDGVTLEPGLYRLITLEASSRVATPAMHRAVAPGHRLVRGDSGFAGDYKPVQVDESGKPLKVNPDDIVQIWTLTAQEAAAHS